MDAEPSKPTFALRNHLPSVLYNHLVAALSEFLGTTIFLFLALAGTQVANTTYLSPTEPGSHVDRNHLATSQQLLYSSLSFAFSLVVCAWIFFRVTSGLFNPAITLGMCLIGALEPLRAMLIIFVQLLAAMVAAALVACVFPGPLRAQTLLSRGTSVTRGFFIELLLTAIFVFAVFMLAAERHKGTFIAPIGIGLALFVVQLAGALFTGCSLNPARSFGTALAARSFPGYHWIYWLAPLLGSILAAALYKLVKALESDIASGMNGPAAFGHRRGTSTGSTMHGGPVGRRPSNAGHALGTVREDDIEKGQAGSEGPLLPADRPTARYLSGMTAVSDSNADDTDTSNDVRSPRQSIGGTGRAL